MHAAACRFRDNGHGSLVERALNQAARSLLLAQASDWAFIMKTGTAVDYAQGRIRDHLARLHALLDAVDEGAVDPGELIALETMDNIFPNLDFRIYA